jgi:myo-inositol-1(or 4)-monophosphatase
VAARKSIGDAVVATGIPHRGRPEHGRVLAEISAAIREVSGVRRTGSAAIDLAWTAAGRFDAYWEHNIQPWDLAAGILIVREAGGAVSDLDGGAEMLEKGSVLAGNPMIHKGLLDILKSGRG